MNGRVIDPETMFNAVANVGVKNGRIVIITQDEISGKEKIDAKGLVVAPGFIDTHVHGIDPFTTKMVLRDGVTTAMDLDDKDLYLLDKIGNLGPLRLKPLTTTSLGDFINSGSYSAFLTGEIKNHLLVYNSEIQNVDFTLDRFEVFWKEIEWPYLIKHFSILDMYTQSLSNSRRQASRLTENTILKSNKKYFTNDFEAFFNNREFASMYTARFAELRAVLNAMKYLDISIDDLIKSINTNL